MNLIGLMTGLQNNIIAIKANAVCTKLMCKMNFQEVCLFLQRGCVTIIQLRKKSKTLHFDHFFWSSYVFILNHKSCFFIGKYNPQAVPCINCTHPFPTGTPVCVRARSCCENPWRKELTLKMLAL